MQTREWCPAGAWP